MKKFSILLLSIVCAPALLCASSRETLFDRIKRLDLEILRVKEEIAELERNEFNDRFNGRYICSLFDLMIEGPLALDEAEILIREQYVNVQNYLKSPRLDKVKRSYLENYSKQLNLLIVQFDECPSVTSNLCCKTRFGNNFWSFLFCRKRRPAAAVAGHEN